MIHKWGGHSIDIRHLSGAHPPQHLHIHHPPRELPPQGFVRWQLQWQAPFWALISGENDDFNIFRPAMKFQDSKWPWFLYSKWPFENREEDKGEDIRVDIDCMFKHGFSCSLGCLSWEPIVKQPGVWLFKRLDEPQLYQEPKLTSSIFVYFSCSL